MKNFYSKGVFIFGILLAMAGGMYWHSTVTKGAEFVIISTCSAGKWTPPYPGIGATIPWKKTAVTQDFIHNQNNGMNYSDSSFTNYDMGTPSCTAAATNGATCNVTYDAASYGAQTSRVCTSPANRIDTVAPSCNTGTWSAAGSTFTLSGVTDTGNTGGDSGINVAGGNCTAPVGGGTCTVQISDVAGNTKVCTSPVYTPPPSTVSASVSSSSPVGSGSVSPSSQQVAIGGKAIISITANSNYQLDPYNKVFSDCPAPEPLGSSGFTSNNTQYTTGTFSSQKNCSATFNFIPLYTITPSAGANCIISPSTVQRVAWDQDSQIFTMSGASGYQVSDVKIDGTSIGAFGSYSFQHVNANHTIAVTCSATASPVNGACSIPQTHYTCSAGTSSGTTGDTTTLYKWNCNGSNGGTNASCTEAKPLPELTASSPTPATATLNIAQTFTSTITNNGTASTGASFYNLFQVASSSAGGGTITDIIPATSTTSLAAGANRAVTSPSYTFTTTGTKSVRACADKNSAAGTGTITESNEANNCSSWKNVTVTATPVPVVTLTANPTSGTVNVVNPTLTWSATNTPTSCTASGDWTGAKAVSGSNVSQGVLTQVKTYTYTLTCTNAGGTSSPVSATVTVSAPPVMSGTLTASDCTIASGASSCNSSLVWSTTNPVATSSVTTPTSITVASGNSGGPITYGVANGSRTFYLYNNAQLLAQDTSNAACTSGTSWNGTICAVVPPPMSGALTPAASFCTIALNASSCTVNMGWSITNPQATPTAITATGMTNINVSNSTTPSSQSGSTAVTVVYNNRTFYLYNNAVLLDQKNISATCALGSGWDGSKCASQSGQKINGGWSGWSACSASCGGGIQVRSCTSPAPSGGGTYCSTDPDAEMKACNTQACGAGTVVNGACTTTHYNCSSGISINNGGDADSWTWTCQGSGGGIPASCSQSKKKPIFIED
jgi:hypothetical protein